MKKVILILVCCIFSSKIYAVVTTQACGDNDNITGIKYGVSGKSINIRKGPGTNFEKVINQKASSILGRTQYVSISDSVTVLEECNSGAWSKIQVIDPSYLNSSHRGWVASKFLRKPENVQYKGSWYSDWSSDFNFEIAKTLSANRIRGCGEFRFRRNMSNKSDFVVKCRGASDNWVYYQVSTSRNSVSRK